MNINEALIKSYDILKEADIESYKIDAQILLCMVLKKDKMFIMLNRDYELSVEEKSTFIKFIELRKEKMPIKYITESCEFMGIDFFVKEGVLIPRPDTEILVEETLSLIKSRKYTTICDVCCGSGAIGISIAKFCNNVEVDLIDISPIALEVTDININRLEAENNCNVYFSDLLENPINNGKRFDCIVSNPPYIRKDVIPELMEDVKNYEPTLALDGGEDGLDFYRKITEQSKQLLNNGGVLAFEIGHDQKVEVSTILEKNGFEDIKSYKDLAGLDRVVLGTFG